MTTTHTSGAADRAIENCPELNMGNYDEVGVERLNDWAIRAHVEIDRLHALAAGQATAALASAPAPAEQPVMPTEPHADARARWQPGQQWLCRLRGTDEWSDLPKTEMPMWLPHVEYRRHPDCRHGVTSPAQSVAEIALKRVLKAVQAYLPPDGPSAHDTMTEIIEIVDPWPLIGASHGQAPAGATKPTEQQILEAAEKAGLWPNTVHSWITAFHRYHKELAKAQPAPAQAAEPVAWGFKYDDGTWHTPSTTEHSSGMRPLFAAPQPVAREPLTDEQIQDLLLCGNPTDEEMRLIRIGWDAANGIKGGQP